MIDMLWEQKEEGKGIGKEIGEEKMAGLTKLLVEECRYDDAIRAASDKAYRERLYEE